jgi:hypothetical protein
MIFVKTKKIKSMKRIAIILIALTAILYSCSKVEVWLDNVDPTVYLPLEGVSINTAWMLDTDEYTLELGIYLGGVRPDNQNSDIEVSFTIDPTLITTYNDDITQQYAGQVIQLPADCYQIDGTTAVIPKGEVSIKVPIRIFTDKVEALGMGADDIYAIPVKLASTSKFKLSDNAEQLMALYGVKLEQPRFYFWVNRDATSSPVTIGRKVIYGETPKVENFLVTSYGLTADESYTLTFAVDPSRVPAGQQILPADAYELPVTTVEIPAGSLTANFPVKIINNAVAFRQTFFLPVSITAVSKFGCDPVKGTLLLRVDIKNDYEWTYISKLSITSETTGRTAAYQDNKLPTSYDESTLRIQMIRNTSIAGGTTGTSTTYNNKFYRLKMIPNPTDKRNWGVEIIRITDEGTNNSPVTLELDPDKPSYFDWDYETIYLNYRWKHTDGKWIWATEILEAQF